MTIPVARALRLLLHGLDVANNFIGQLRNLRRKRHQQCQHS